MNLIINDDVPMTDNAKHFEKYQKEPLDIDVGNFDISKKLSNREGISKADLYMNMCYLVAQRSKDPNTQVGAVIVGEDDRIRSLGYNGFCSGIPNDIFPWNRESAYKEDSEHRLPDTKYPYVVHSELNAILNYRGGSLAGSTLYVSLFPCNECAKAIIQAGIKYVIYEEDKYADTASVKASKAMFDYAGVKYKQYTRMHKIFIS